MTGLDRLNRVLVWEPCMCSGCLQSACMGAFKRAGSTQLLRLSSFEQCPSQDAALVRERLGHTCKGLVSSFQADAASRRGRERGVVDHARAPVRLAAVLLREKIIWKAEAERDATHDRGAEAPHRGDMRHDGAAEAGARRRPLIAAVQVARSDAVLLQRQLLLVLTYCCPRPAETD
jgi:hypothetical protein